MTPPSERTTSEANKYSVLCQRYSRALQAGEAYPLDGLLSELPAAHRPDFLGIYLNKRLEAGDLPTLSGLCAEYPRIRPVLAECYPKVPLGLRLPEQLGDYEVERFVSNGKYARTVTGIAPDKTRVLIKYHWLEKYKPFLRREFDILGVCQHKNIRAAVDADLDHPLPYIVLEYVDGSVLTRRHDPNKVSRSLRWLRDICLAVSHLHDQEKCHHDIKPDNIIIGELGTAKLIDFGFAVEEYVDGERRQAGEAVGGTSGYLAPEKALLRPNADSRLCDVFSLGATLFFVLNGRHPPPVLKQDASGQATDKLDWKPSFKGCRRPPPQLAKLCLSAMELDPAQRCASAGTLAEQLSNYLRWRIAKPFAAKVLAPPAIASALLVVPPMLVPTPPAYRDAADGGPAWYHDMATAKGFELADIQADDFDFSLRKSQWVENPNAPLPHADLVLEPTDIDQDLIGYLQMRTSPRSEWRTVLIDGIEGTWYWQLTAEDHDSSARVEVRFKNPINDPDAEILGPYVTDYRIERAMEAYQADFREKFDKLLAKAWVEYRPGLGWQYRRDLHGPVHSVLAAVAAGTEPDQLIDTGNIVGLGGIAPQVQYSPTIYVQLTSLTGEKSEIRKFDASVADLRRSTSGRVGEFGGGGGGI